MCCWRNYFYNSSWFINTIVSSLVFTEYDAFSGTGKIRSESLLTKDGYVYAGGGGHTQKHFKVPTGKENLNVILRWNEFEEKIEVKAE